MKLMIRHLLLYVFIGFVFVTGRLAAKLSYGIYLSQRMYDSITPNYCLVYAFCGGFSYFMSRKYFFKYLNFCAIRLVR